MKTGDEQLMAEEKMIYLAALGDDEITELNNLEEAQYLIQPIAEQSLFAVLDRLLQGGRQERKKYILLKAEGRLMRVAVNDIVYCEAQGKTQCLYFADGRECRQRMTMTELYEVLSAYQEFVRIGAAFIVNLEYIDSMSAQDICLTGGKKIYLPRGTYKGLREQYSDYYCKMC